MVAWSVEVFDQHYPEGDDGLRHRKRLLLSSQEAANVRVHGGHKLAAAKIACDNATAASAF